MKPRHCILLASLPLAAGLTPKSATAQDQNAPSPRTQPSETLTPGSILAAQVTEIAEAKDLSRSSKNRQITSAIRLAIITATTGVKNPEDALKIVLDLVQVAAKAAPEFAEIIPQAIPDLPVLAGITNLKSEVQDAVFAGIKAAAVDNGVAHFESNNPPKPPDNPEFGGHTGDVVVSPSH